MDFFQKFYDRALRFLSFRPRSEKEVVDFLKKKSARGGSALGGKVDSSIIDKILKKLKQQNLIDDQEFAKWWVGQRTNFRPRGERVIKMELRQKGINQEIIDKILSNKDIKILSKETLKKLVEKQWSRYKNLPKKEAYQKLSQFLLRRGFDWETVKNVVDPDSIGVDEVLKK